MRTDYKQAAMYLDAVAAKAKALASDARNNKLWEGELNSGISQISGDLSKAAQCAKNDR